MCGGTWAGASSRSSEWGRRADEVSFLWVGLPRAGGEKGFRASLNLKPACLESLHTFRLLQCASAQPSSRKGACASFFKVGGHGLPKSSVTPASILLPDLITEHHRRVRSPLCRGSLRNEWRTPWAWVRGPAPFLGALKMGSGGLGRQVGEGLGRRVGEGLGRCHA